MRVGEIVLDNSKILVLMLGDMEWLWFSASVGSTLLLFLSCPMSLSSFLISKEPDSRTELVLSDPFCTFSDCSGLIVLNDMVVAELVENSVDELGPINGLWGGIGLGLSPV